MITTDLSSRWPGAVVPVRLELAEAISECFLLTLDLIGDDAEVDPADLLQQPAGVTFGLGDTRRSVTGVVTALGLMGRLPGGQCWHRVRIEPGLRLLDLTRRSRVFCTEQAASVPQVLRQVLDGGVDAPPPATVSFDLKTTDYPLRDMVVQHDESDLAFLCRLAEDVGIFWASGASAGGETLLLGDSNLSFPMLEGVEGGVLPFRPSTGMADAGPALRAATLHDALVPRGVVLNERAAGAPDMVLRVRSTASGGGLGLLQSAGEENYVDARWGAVLAEVRAQEARAGRTVLSGETDCATLAAGRAFTLRGHPARRVEGDYVATRVRHHAWRSAPGIEHLPGERPRANGYAASFEAIPADVPFRPARRTPWPSIPGLIRAVVDGADGLRSELDGSGFYRIVFPFDDAPHPPGQASCPVRMISPYGGPSEGMHFPLRPGTQVLVGFHNGDPDRPVILGAVPDAVQRSVVTQDNRTASMIRTASGITLRFNDGLPSSA